MQSERRSLITGQNSHLKYQIQIRSRLIQTNRMEHEWTIRTVEHSNDHSIL